MKILPADKLFTQCQPTLHLSFQHYWGLIKAVVSKSKELVQHLELQTHFFFLSSVLSFLIS